MRAAVWLGGFGEALLSTRAGLAANPLRLRSHMVAIYGVVAGTDPTNPPNPTPLPGARRAWVKQ